MKKLFFLILMIPFIGMNAQMSKIDSLTFVKSNLEGAYDYIKMSKEYMSEAKAAESLESIAVLINNLKKEIESQIPIENATPNQGEGDSNETVPNETTSEVMEEIDPEETVNAENHDMPSMNTNYSNNPFEKKGLNFYFEFGLNSITGGGNFDIDTELNTGGSWFCSFSILKKIVASKGIDMSLGLGYNINSFRFENGAVLRENGDNSKFVAQSGLRNDPTLKLKYLTLPLLADVHLGKKTHLYLGATPGYRVDVTQDISRKVGSEKVVEARSSSYGLNNWMVAGKLGLGYGRFDIFGQYNLTNVFKTKNVYENNIAAIGTMLKF